MTRHTDLREAAEKATPGPWDGTANHAYVTCETGDIADVLDGQPPTTDGLDFHQARANAAFIALANPARILSLIEENERMREALESIAEPPIGYADLNPNDLVIILAENARAALKEKP